MEEIKHDYSLNDILNVIKVYQRHLLKRWWLLIVICFIGGALGVIYYYRQKPKYEAATTFILEEKSGGGGGLAGISSQFGINVGNLNGGESLFAGDNILSILKSKKIIQEVLLSHVGDTTSGGQTLGDLYLEFTGIRKGWEKKIWLANINFVNSKKETNPIQDSILNVIYEALINNNLSAERTSKQGSIIKVQVTAENSLFARLMSERLVEEASKLYFDIKTRTAEANILQLQRRSDSLLLILNRKSFIAAASQPLDVNPAAHTATVANEIVMRDKTVLATLYGEVVKNLEASKLVLSQQAPVIQVLDRPEYLLRDKKKSMNFWVALFAAGLCIIYIIGDFVFFLRLAKNGK